MMWLHLGCLCFIYCIATCMGYWCSSFMGSTKSEEFVTEGGTVPPGTPCCFPFVYRDRTYSGCTNVGHGRRWCAVESVYQENKRWWGNCRQVEIPPPSSANTCRDPSKLSAVFVTRGGTVPNGTPCCFPFAYRGTFYYSCTTVDHSQSWCAVGSAFLFRDKKWGNCQRTDVEATLKPPPQNVYQCTALSERSTTYVTVGGTAQQGSPCCFPFYYKETLYNECTLRDHVQLWCAVETLYRRVTNLWGNCLKVPTAASGTFTCNAFPNSRKSNQFFTRGGSVPQGTPCCFPFVYQGETYNECTRKDHDQPWCAVESVFREYNKRWGNCREFARTASPGAVNYTCNGVSSSSSDIVTQGGGVADGTPCCFPFAYFGRTYYGCITLFHGRPWCAVENAYNDAKKNWGNCIRTATPAPPVAPYNCDPALSTRSTEITTRGGTVVPGSPCCFPFQYGGKTYNDCTRVDHNEEWCAVESVFSKSTKLWGNCVRASMASTTTLAPGTFRCSAFKNSAKSTNMVTRGGSVPNGTPCCFPFIYKGQIFSRCTTVGHTRPWCCVDSLYDESNKKWGNCVPATP